MMKILYPVEQINISQPFGYDNRNHRQRSKFYTLFDNRHPGIDFDLLIGTEVYASFEGIVVRKEFHKGMGNVVGVRNGNIVALYAHLNSINVELGQVVDTGGLIGLSGDTGSACLTPHLHFELRDVSKANLKEMVFDPPFNKEVPFYNEIFVYSVNNRNTPKNLKSLSKLYFGTENYWNVIKVANDLSALPEEIIKETIEITIPNFTQLP